VILMMGAGDVEATEVLFEVAAFRADVDGVTQE
jgi:hypothetical protein